MITLDTNGTIYLVFKLKKLAKKKTIEYCLVMDYLDTSFNYVDYDAKINRLY